MFDRRHDHKQMVKDEMREVVVNCLNDKQECITTDLLHMLAEPLMKAANTDSSMFVGRD